MTNLRIITPPTAEPMTLGEAMEALRISLDIRDEDDWLNRKIKQARETVEEYTSWPLTDAVYEYRCDRFAQCGIGLPLQAVAAVSSVVYLDADGAEQTLASSVYWFDDNERAPWIRLVYGQSWPYTQAVANAVRVQFRGRYSETESPPRHVPEWARGAMELLIAHWHENREAVLVNANAVELPLGVESLLFPKRVLGV